jgi:hypothetical protein
MLVMFPPIFVNTIERCFPNSAAPDSCFLFSAFSPIHLSPPILFEYMISNGWGPTLISPRKGLSNAPNR